MKPEDDDAAKLEALESAVQERPMSGDAWADLGMAYARAGQHELAASALRRATRLEPECAWYWYKLSVSLSELNQGEAALDAARKAVARAPAPQAMWTRVNLGRRLLRSGRPHEAVRYLEEATRMAPTDESALGALGIAYFRAEQYGAAADCLEDLLRRTPDEGPIVWAYLGVSLDETGRHEGAVHALESATYNQPDYAWAWGRLGKVLRALGRHEEAVRAYEKSIEHGFAPPVVWSDFGNSAAEVRDLERLRRACRELGRLDAEMAKPLRRRLRSLRVKERASASCAA